MNPEFWQQRWENKQIGFNQSAIDPILTAHFPALNLSAGNSVFVPLCGKSIDMRWLAEQGYNVVGVELVESAVQQFFIEQDLTATITQSIATDNSSIKCYQGQLAGQTISLWAANIFALTPADIGPIDAVYDRAALIALPPDMRPRYNEQVRALTGNAPQYLLTLNYEQSQRNGPPFSISSQQVEDYYSGHYQITELLGEPTILNAAPEMAVTGHVWLLEHQ